MHTFIDTFYYWKAFKEQVTLPNFIPSKRQGIFIKHLEIKSLLCKLHKRTSVHADDCISQIRDLEEISALLANRADGAKVRANVDILDNAERSSRYFYRWERSRQSKILINKLVDCNLYFTS